MDKLDFTQDAIKEHIDQCIVYWRKKKINAVNSEDVLVATCYVDAYQSMRTSIFNELLPPNHIDTKHTTPFEKGLEELINSHSMENDSNTPDFILAEYLQECLDSFNNTTNKRDKWNGAKLKPESTQAKEKG